MWLGGKEAALDGIILKCKDIQRNYENVSNLIEDPAVGHLFKDLAIRRKEWIVRLESEMGKMGGLPSDKDPERQTLEGLFVRAKAVLSDNERNTLLKECAKKEEDLEILIRKAILLDFPEDIRSVLLDLEEEAKKTQRLLLGACSGD